MERNKKILLNDINFMLPPHGRISWVLKMNYFVRNGCSVSIITSDDGANYYKNKIVLENLIIVPYCKNISNKLVLIWEGLKRNIIAIFSRKIQNIDIIYSLATLDNIIYPYYLKKINKKTKWVVQFDNTVPLFSEGKIIAGNRIIRFLAWFFYRISLLFLREADCIFVIKPELREYLLKKGFRETQMVITGNGVEIDLIRKSKKDNKYNIDALFVGRINEAKGIYDMLRVLDIVRKIYPNFQLAMMGTGDHVTEKNFKKKIYEMQLTNNIQFLGYKTGQEKFDVFKSSKCFLFLSETESVPIAPLEAVCSGLKTFVYDLDAYNMYKNNEVMMYEMNDYKSVAEGVLRLFESKDFENKSGKLLLNKYSWEKIAEIEYDNFI